MWSIMWFLERRKRKKKPNQMLKKEMIVVDKIMTIPKMKLMISKFMFLHPMDSKGLLKERTHKQVVIASTYKKLYYRHKIKEDEDILLQMIFSV